MSKALPKTNTLNFRPGKKNGKWFRQKNQNNRIHLLQRNISYPANASSSTQYAFERRKCSILHTTFLNVYLSYFYVLIYLRCLFVFFFPNPVTNKWHRPGAFEQWERETYISCHNNILHTSGIFGPLCGCVVAVVVVVGDRQIFIWSECLSDRIFRCVSLKSGCIVVLYAEAILSIFIRCEILLKMLK